MKLLIFVLVVIYTGLQVKGKCEISDADRNEVTESLYNFAQLGSPGSLNCNNKKKLIEWVPESLLLKKTINEMEPLLYQNKVNWKEYLDVIVKTQVMEKLESFLNKKSCLPVSTTLSSELERLWLTTYKRRKKTSSGFQHVFLGEKSGSKVGGFHNWVKFREEQRKEFLTFQSCSNIENRVVALNGLKWINGTFNGGIKNVSTMFIFTTPELELALYTLCFLSMPGEMCSVMLNNNPFNIQTCEMPDTGVISTAHPVIPGVKPGCP